MNKKMLAMIMVGALLIVAATSAWLLASGRVEFVIKAPSDRVVVTPRVCGDDTIAAYNSVIKSKDIAQRTERLKEADSAVAKLKDADSDPNCMYIRYSYSLENKQYDNAQKYLSALKSLAKDHKYATAELSDTQSVELMEERLNGIKAASKNDSSSDPSKIPLVINGRG